MKKQIVFHFLLLSTFLSPLVAFSSGDGEGSVAVGPDKGILSASASEGIKLAPEAIKNFELRTQKISGAAPWEVSSGALLTSGEEVNVYRLRDGFYRRIDIELVSKATGKIRIKAKDLAPGDEVVVNGIGFLRAAELTALSDEAESQGH